MEGGADEDMADGMQCSDHPYRTNPHGICPLCLQEKLGKLLSSSLPLPLRPSSPPSPTSFRSDHFLPPPSSSASRPSSSSLSLPQSLPNNNAYQHHHHHSRRSRLHFLSTKKKHKKKPSVTPSSSSASAAADVVFKRSKSTATPRRGRLLDDPGDGPRKRNGFWSFLHLSSKSSSSSVSAKKPEAKSFRDGNNNSPSSGKQKEKCDGSSSLVGRKIDIVVEEDDETCNSRQTSASSFERKVSRSRSVGCGSRSFSGDFFERISTGFGDCALRRVESQREGKPKVARRSGPGAGDHHHSMKERARCGGLFSGFMLNSSSSSSSSSSYLVSSSNDDQTTGRKSESMVLSQNRGRYWGWAFASPMRVFTTKPSNSKDVKNNATPNLSAIPSLLAVRG